MQKTALVLTLLVAFVAAQEAFIYEETTCTKGRDSACDTMATKYGVGFCCANITSQETGQSASTIYRCMPRSLPYYSPMVSGNNVTTYYTCTTSTPSGYEYPETCNKGSDSACANETHCCTEVVETFGGETTTWSEGFCVNQSTVPVDVTHDFGGSPYDKTFRVGCYEKSGAR